MHINMDEKNEQRRKLHHEADVVVVGAGILGCAVAVALGNQGRSVIVLERSQEVGAHRPWRRAAIDFHFSISFHVKGLHLSWHFLLL